MKKQIEEKICEHCKKPLSQCARNQNYFGKAFNEVRVENKKTLVDFANILDVKVQYIMDIEIGKERPSVEEQLKLTNALGIDPFEFINRSLAKSPLTSGVKK